jgi:hypothetical protein
LDLDAPGLLALSGGFVAFILFIVAISALFDWIKKKSQENADDAAEPYVYRPKPPGATTSTESSQPMSDWEEEISRLLRGETAPPPVPPPPPQSLRRSPPPLPAYSGDPLLHETEGRAEQPVPTYLASMERPDSAFDRGSHLEERVRARLAQVSDRSESQVAMARAGSIDDRVAARMAAAGQLRASQSPAFAPTAKPAARTELRGLVEALRSPVHARGAIVASVILGPPKALERPS